MIKKFGDALKVIRVLLAIIPLIRPLINQSEIPGFGPEKKAAVLTALGNIIAVLPWAISPEVKKTVLTIVGGLIDVIVGILNLIGHDWNKALE